MISIRVFSKSSGKPVKSIRVSLGFGGFFGTNSGPTYTDANGDTHFDVDP